MDGSDASTPPAPPGRVRTLWVMAKVPTGRVTAAIYEHPAGHELRIYYGADEGHVVDAFVSREGEAVLVARADALRTVLEEHGWTRSE